MGYQCALYQGGIIATTRPFCKKRNGKVFTRDEIKLFGTSKDKFGGYERKGDGYFKGKYKSGYNPLTDAGCYNCRHFYNWISNRLAIRLRPELKPILNKAA
jgi:hypothetical protein